MLSKNPGPLTDELFTWYERAALPDMKIEKAIDAAIPWPPRSTPPRTASSATGHSVRSLAASHRNGSAVILVQGHGAMVPGADANPFEVQYLRYVVRVNVLHRESNDATALVRILGSDDLDVGQPAELVQRVHRQFALVRADILHAEGL